MPWKKIDLKRSYSCNTELLLKLRENKGWTQQKLASVAGYSERLIRKAESGQPVSTNAIEVIAESLSNGEEEVHPEDLICDPVALAKAFTAAVYSGNPDLLGQIRHFLDDKIVFHFSGDAAHIPFAGVHRGIDEVEAAFKIVFSILEAPADFDYEPYYNYISAGSSVFIQGQTWLHPIGQPMEAGVEIAILMKFRRGKLWHYQDWLDTETGSKILKEFSQNKKSPKQIDEDDAAES